MSRVLLGIALLLALGIASVPAPVHGDESSALGYAGVRQALVQIWGYDESQPIDSGTGFVVWSDNEKSVILTADHVVKGAKSVRVALARDRPPVPARIVAEGRRDVALLEIDQGGLRPVMFAPPSHPAMEGNTIAVAGFVQSGDTVADVNATAQLRTGAVSARLDDGALLELTNVELEGGFSGGPVFDPATGDIVGLVNTRSIYENSGGYAVSAPAILLVFLHEQHISATIAKGAGGEVIQPPAAPVPDASLRDEQVTLTLGAAHKVTVLAIPFQEPGQAEQQLAYESSYLVKSLKRRGYDTIALAPIDHLQAVAQAGELCKANAAAGMFVGSVLYELLRIGHLAAVKLNFVNCAGRPLWQATVPGSNIERAVDGALDQFQASLKSTDVGSN